MPATSPGCTTDIAVPGCCRAPRDGSSLRWEELTRLSWGPAAPGCGDGACCPLLSSKRLESLLQPIAEPIPLPPASGSPPLREVKPSWPDVWKAREDVPPSSRLGQGHPRLRGAQPSPPAGTVGAHPALPSRASFPKACGSPVPPLVTAINITPRPLMFNEVCLPINVLSRGRLLPERDARRTTRRRDG